MPARHHDKYLLGAGAALDAPTWLGLITGQPLLAHLQTVQEDCRCASWFMQGHKLPQILRLSTTDAFIEVKVHSNSLGDFMSHAK